MDKNLEILRNIIIRNYNIDVKQKRRTREIVDAKKLFCLIAIKNLKKITYTKIGQFLERDHATIIHHVKSAKDFVKFDKEFKNLHDQIKQEFFLLNKDVLLSEIDSEIYLLESRIEFLKNKKLEFSN